MDPTQYLAFVPLLIYGLGISTLMKEWERMFDPKEIYLPYSLLTLVLTEVAVYNVFIYIRVIAQFDGQNYLTYLLYLVPPVTFNIAAHVFTPDTGANTKEYFIKKMPIFFTLFAIFTSTHFIYQSEESSYANEIRIFLVIFLIFIGFSRKVWLTYVFVGLWLLSFFMKGSIISI